MNTFEKQLLKYENAIFTTRRRSLRRLCFHRCLSVHGGVSAPLHAGIHTPWADTPWDRHPPCPVHAGIHTSPCPVHAGIYTPLCRACWDTVNKRPVHIPLECILVFIKFRRLVKIFMFENRKVLYSQKYGQV